MVHRVFPGDVPSRVFAGRLFGEGRWHRIEVDSAGPLQIAMPGGTGFGIGSRVRILHGGRGKEFWVMVDAGGLSGVGQAVLDQVKTWIPKRAVVCAAAVVGKKQHIPESGIFWVDAPDFSKDPQRSDACAFRRRCRFDVLSVMASCVNSDPPEQSCNFARLQGADTHTRIYERDDFVDAIQFWERKGYVRLLTRGLDVSIDQTRDEDMLKELSGYSWDEGLPRPVANAPTSTAASVPPAEYDVFICHASEDKAAVVFPLTAELTRQGLRVWVDYKELRLGDKLRQRIDDGLARSRFGVVIVSPRFFEKAWPQAELDGLIALEMAQGKKRILPVWYDVDCHKVAMYSPGLATRLAVRWDEGLAKVVADIVCAVQD